MPYRRIGGDEAQREERSPRRRTPRKRPIGEEPVAPALPAPKRNRKHRYASRPQPAPEDPGWLRALYKLATGCVLGMILGVGLSYTIPMKKTVKKNKGMFKQQFAKQGAGPRQSYPPPVFSESAPSGAAGTSAVTGAVSSAPASPEKNGKMQQYRYEREAWAVIAHLENKLGLREN